MAASEVRKSGAPWENWSGSLRFQPSRIVRPSGEGEVVQLIKWARRHRRKLKPVGSGHSSTRILETDDTLVSLERLSGLIRHGHDEATLRSGTDLRTMGEQLQEAGLSPHNLGDVALQTIAGAIGTGTHGTGRGLGNLSTMLIGGRLVTGAGEVISFSIEDDPELTRCLRISLGALGIFTEMRLRLLPAYRLRRSEYFTSVDSTMAQLDALMAGNRNFDFYWYPRSDEVKLRLMNEPGSGMDGVPDAVCVEDREGWAADILHKHSAMTNKFDEMEYALPAEAAPRCFLDIRERIRARWRRIVGWRVLYRTVAADDTPLSPAYGRETVSISLHQNAGLPWQEYFRDIEPIFRHYGGRPHWAKKHGLRAAQLRPLYPEWERFMRLRRSLDPDGVFLTPYLRQLFGEGV